MSKPFTPIQLALRAHSSSARATAAKRYFKTGPGQYGEGDRFLGVTVPDTRKVAKIYRDLPWSELEALLTSPWHEERLLALIIWVARYQKGDAATREEIVYRYLAHTKWINNWDLVDTSAPYIIGQHFVDDPKPLYALAKSTSLWERRIAIVSTLWLIRQGKYQLTFDIADTLLTDAHDLIHKATGWMLREVGKAAGEEVLEAYLTPRLSRLPRTTLRYAIERFAEGKRKQLMRKIGSF